MKLIQFNIAILMMMFLSSCVEGNTEKVSGDPLPQAVDSNQISLENEQDFNDNKLPTLTYNKIGNINREAIDSLKELYTNVQWRIILATNRVDENYVWRLDSLIIPENFHEDYMHHSPFPANLPIAADVKKLLVFSYPVQAFAAYEHGKLVHWGPTSMGRQNRITPVGLLSANWKARESISTVNDSWRLPWNVNIHNSRGVSIHQYDLPGEPASHACLRLYEHDAEWNFNWIDTWILDNRGIHRLAHGTPVVIYGEYPWNETPAWMKLHLDPEAATVTIEELEKVIQEHLETILQRQEQRLEIERERQAL